MTDTSYIRSWDDFVDAVGSLPREARIVARLRLFTLLRTAQQLNKFGVPFPHQLPKDSTHE